MATQRAVANAFFRGEDAPRRASNFRVVTFDGGYSAALIGDDRAVFAVREPFESYRVYVERISFIRSRNPGVDVHNGALQDQHGLTLTVANNRIDSEEPGVEFVDARPPEPDELDHNVNG